MFHFLVSEPLTSGGVILSKFGAIPFTATHRVWCSGNIADSHELYELYHAIVEVSAARGSTPRTRDFIFFLCSAWCYLLFSFLFLQSAQVQARPCLVQLKHPFLPKTVSSDMGICYTASSGNQPTDQSVHL